MNNKIITDETARLRTRQLLRFSDGIGVLFGSFSLLILSGWAMLYRGASIASILAIAILVFVCASGVIINRIIINKRKRKSIYAESMQPRFNWKRFFIRFVIIFPFLLLFELLFEHLRVIDRSISGPVKLAWLVTLLVASFDLFAFYKARLLEDMIFPVIIFGGFLVFIVRALVSTSPNNMPFYLSLLVLAAFIQMIHGIILCVRWQRATRQIPDKNREEKAT